MKYLAAITIALVAAPAWSVNKCTDAAGKVTYQAEACPQQGGKIVLHNTAPTTNDRTWLDEWGAKSARLREEYMRALKERIAACGPKAELPPTVGMSEADFLCTRAGVAGVEKINRTTTVGGERKQYVMRESSRGTHYVYTENGVVTAIQD